MYHPSASDSVKIIKASEDTTMKGFDSKSLGVNNLKVPGPPWEVADSAWKFHF